MLLDTASIHPASILPLLEAIRCPACALPSASASDFTAA
jgi:hypothetical protein